MADLFTPKSFDFTSLKPSQKISDLYKSLFPSMVPTGNGGATVANLGAVTRNLPNGGGSYESPVLTQPQTPPATNQVPPATPASKTVTPPDQSRHTSLDYSKYTDPVTGKVLSPTEWATYLAKRAASGAIPSYAGDSATQGPQTTTQLESTATDLNNQRNDIKVGETDPYKVASKSGIAYNPTELAAIEKAYAGIYDPAIKDVYAKLEQKQKEDASALDLKNQLTLQAQKHKDDMELKGVGTTGALGAYVVGANPVVDSWANLIQSGRQKITDIPAAQAGLRNAVSVALDAMGNSTDGRPTTTEIGKQALGTAKDLLTKFESGGGYNNAVGASSLFNGVALPGTQRNDFKIAFQSLKDQLSLDAVKLLKGQGSVSDAERALLSSAVTKLNLSQSEDDFKTTLHDIINQLQGTDGTLVTAPDGTKVQLTD